MTVLQLVRDLWANPALHLPLVTLIGSMAKALDGEFKPFMSNILPHMLRTFDEDLQNRKQNTQMKVLDAFLTFGANIEEYSHLVIPVIVRSYERQDASIALRKRAIQTIYGLTSRVNFSDHASRIIHPLVRVLAWPNNELRAAIMDTLSALVIQLGPDFAIFVPTINKVYQILNDIVAHADTGTSGHSKAQSASSTVPKSHQQTTEWRASSSRRGRLGLLVSVHNCRLSTLNLWL